MYILECKRGVYNVSFLKISLTNGCVFLVASRDGIPLESNLTDHGYESRLKTLLKL